ncbi:N-6 DNA methylase [Candidatus Poriferisocius sp.]|uniref:N-6 DNA methylase n=1 Tax=Candidatus Poriferisocius sp. TaxID=3101276 RepID=UPI003B5C87AB
MSDFKQMPLIDRDDTAGAVPRVESEQELAAVAWTIVEGGALADLTDAESEIVCAAASQRVLDTGELVSTIQRGGDPLGDAFVWLRPPKQRRPLGAVYTPQGIVEAMVGWVAAKERPARVVDPGAGSGRFLLQAGRVFPDASLVAVELDPLAALLCRANLTVAGFDARSTVTVDDYREADLGSCDGVTAFVGNPPYVRHHQIESRWKQWLTSTAASRDLPVSALAGLHIHFFLATLLAAKPGDIGAFITSAEWLDVNYGKLLRGMLVDGLGGESVHVLAPEALAFEDAATTASVTCFQIGSEARSVKMRRVAKTSDLADLSKGRRVSKERLIQEKRWSPLLSPVPPPPDGFVELGELCRVHRGAVTGANATWITTANDPQLPTRTLFPSVTKARELFDANDGVLSSLHSLRAVIDLPADLSELNEDDRALIKRFLRLAERNGAHSSYVARHRNPWWSVGLRSPAPILATYMARRPPAFVRNLAGARHVNVAHGIYPRDPLSDDALDTLASSLRSSVSVAQGRTYAGGLTKFEPSEMERIPVPNPALLVEMSS